MEKSLEDTTHDVVEKTAAAQEAIETARATQASISDEKITRALSIALRDVFGENVNSGRFIDTNRIPLICQDLKGMHVSLSGIEDNIKWIVRIVLGAVVLGLIGLLITK